MSCCVVGCTNRFNKNNKTRRFYRIPSTRTPFKANKRRLWLQAIRRIDWNEQMIKNATICSDHFLSGLASDDIDSPNFVPSVFPYSTQSDSDGKLGRYKRKRRRDETPSTFPGNGSQSTLTSISSKPAADHCTDVQIHLSADPKLKQEITETPQIKEEPEEQSIKQEEDQLQEFTAVSVKSEEFSPLLQQRQTEHRKETQGENCGGTVQNLGSFKTETLPDICDIVIKDVFSLSDIKYKTEDPGDSSSDTDYDDWEPPTRSSTQQIETEVEGDDYNHVQMKAIQNPTLQKHYGYEKTFIENSKLKAHVITHTGEKSYSCSICKKTLKRKSNLKTHVKTHTGEKPYSCSVCKKTFTVKGNLNTHMRIHTGEKPYSCSICKKSFNQNMSLKKHMITHAKEKSYSDLFCEKTFINKSNSHEIQMRFCTVERPYSCSICKKTFKRKRNLKAHVKTHTGEKPYSCSFCKKTFTVKGGLTTHMRIHTGEKPYSCSICKKSFNQNMILKKHMITHAKEKSYSDLISEKTLINKNNSHEIQMRFCTVEKPYSCSICKKTFVQSAHLNTHMRTHTGEKPYSCSVCKETFAQNGQLKRHSKIHSGDKPFSCSICKNTFSMFQNLKIHMIIHTGERPYSCLICNNTFNRKSYLKTHMKTHTGEKPYSCSICKKTFTQKNHVKRHEKTHNIETLQLICNVSENTQSMEEGNVSELNK